MEGIIHTLTKPVLLPLRSAELLLAIPRLVTAFIMMVYYGIPNLPVQPNLLASITNAGLPLPHALAWLTVIVQLVGGLFLLIGFKTRISAFFISILILTSIITGYWGDELSDILPPLGFLWVALYSIVLGSGRFGVDFLIARRMADKLPSGYLNR